MKRNELELDEFFQRGAAHIRHGALKAGRMLDRAGSGQPIGYRSGLQSLDQYMHFFDGEYSLIGARPGTGKTALALQILQSVEEQRRARGKDGMSVFFSAEMSSESLVTRIACARAGVPMFNLRRGEATPEQVEEVRKHINWVVDHYPIFVDETSTPTVSHMVDQIEVMSEVMPVDFVVFDYMELAGEEGGTEAIRVSQISRGLQRIAKTFDVPVLALTQLKRDVEERADRTPRMADIKYGGEQEPHQIMLMVSHETDQGIIVCHLVKNRNGPSGVFHLLFSGPTMRFSSAKLIRTELNDDDS